jgi:hypothetical protein
MGAFGVKIFLHDRPEDGFMRRVSHTGVKRPTKGPGANRPLSRAELEKQGFTCNPQPAPEPIPYGEGRRFMQLWAMLMTRDVR